MSAAIHAVREANPGKRHIVTLTVEHLLVLNYCMAFQWSGEHPHESKVNP